PLYFTLRALGKSVHLANYTFTHLEFMKRLSEPEVLLDDLVVGVRGPGRLPVYFPEGYLAQWFKEARGEDVPVWMFANTGVAPLARGYTRLVEHLGIDAVILVDGGVDSLMRGDEARPGSLIEDTISLAAIERLEVSVKMLACLGFGTEVEEGLCHYHALENMAALAREGAFWGSCALTAQMEAFQLFEAAARYVWEQPNHLKSHISTRIIPSVHGEFGNHHMYDDDRRQVVFISSLMSLYWFFDAKAVIRRSLFLASLHSTETKREVMEIYLAARELMTIRPQRSIPY
ncbi:MAG TPA: DUF1152 domain-containing protein, partial [Abditibacteriaceae bacterium]|nr:DUF1152 domain-containing protein [Abditibacteriaceae bacterium]